MNRLDATRRSQVLRCLVEGSSINSTVRMTGVAKNTVLKLLVEIGSACSAYLDATMRDLKCERLQADEAWSFCYAKQRNVTPEMAEERNRWRRVGVGRNRRGYEADSFLAARQA